MQYAPTPLHMKLWTHNIFLNIWCPTCDLDLWSPDVQNLNIRPRTSYVVCTYSVRLIMALLRNHVHKHFGNKYVYIVLQWAHNTISQSYINFYHHLYVLHHSQELYKHVQGRSSLNKSINYTWLSFKQFQRLHWPWKILWPLNQF